MIYVALFHFLENLPINDVKNHRQTSEIATKSFFIHHRVFLKIFIYVSMPTRTLAWKNNDVESLCGEFV